jgi:NAD(P)-dependent dehydrogenase (short-subunit alcohol dehydrogenase family)
MREVVVIAGASSGVGRASAVRFAREGAAVALLARGEEGLEAAAREVEAAGGTALVVPVDVVDAHALDAAASRVEEELGPIDVWVNSVMAGVFALFEDVEPEEFRRSTEATYLGSVWGVRAALRRMVPRDRGTIVQVGSATAFSPLPALSSYAASKHAVRGFTQSIRCELALRGSRVWITSIHPSGVNTPQFDRCRTKMPRNPRPAGPLYEPEVMAEYVFWASRNRRREVYVGLPALLARLGDGATPWLIEALLSRVGLDALQSKGRVEPRDGNLFAPVPGDPGTRGRFRRTFRHSTLTWASTRGARPVLAGAAAVAAFAAARRRA